MNERTALPLASAAYVAYGVAILFVLAFAHFFLLPPEGAGNLPVALLGIAPHLLLFPLVAALAAPPWARAAGYGWLAIDISTDIMALQGVPQTIFLSMRYGGHISAAMWIATASWQAGGLLRIVGLLLALDLGGYSFLPGAPFLVLLPSLVLLPLWFVLVGRLLARTI